MEKRRSPKAPPSPSAALLALFDQTVALFHRLRAAAEEVHRQGETSAARRGVLRSLDLHGPQTVPHMARARLVSRQHIQTLVNTLSGEGLVEFVENPAHRRSSLVRLTRNGKELMQNMHRREEEALGRLSITASVEDLRAAAAVLLAVRKSLETAGRELDTWESAS